MSHFRMRRAWLGLLTLVLMPLPSCTGSQSEIVTLSRSPITEESGPELAKGAIVFFNGNSIWEKTFTHNSVRVPYIFAEMSRHGWDVFHATLPDRGRRQYDYVDANLALDTVSRLKASGYRKVILAGQSAGAWLILEAGKTESGADGVVLLAPATFGTFNTANAVELYKSLEGWQNVPLVLFNPTNDVYNPVQDRGERATLILNRIGAVHLVINKPLGVSGHASGQYWRFAFLFQKCLEDFLESRVVACKPADMIDQDTRWMSNETELIASGAQLLQVSALPKSLFEKDIAWYNTVADWRIRFLRDNEMLVDYLPISSADYLKNVKLKLREEADGKFCFDLPTSPASKLLCWKIYLSKDGFTHIVGDHGIVVGRSRL